MNRATLIGYLGKDIESGDILNGDKWANTSLATTEHWKDKTGEKKESTEWHNLVFYGKLAEIAAKYLKKGSHVCIEGKIKTRSWPDKNSGEKRYMTEIHVHELEMLDRKGEAVTLSQSETPDDIPF